MIGRDHRAAHCLRFDDHPAEPLGVGRGRDDDIGQGVGRRHILTVLDDPEHADQAMPLDRGLQFAAKTGALLGPDEKAAQIAPLQVGNETVVLGVAESMAAQLAVRLRKMGLHAINPWA